MAVTESHAAGPTDALSGQRIERIEVGTLTSRYPRTVGRNARLGSHGSGGPNRIVRVSTQDGASGWGLAGGPVTGLAGLLGRPLDSVFDPERGVIDSAAVPLDFALHDLAGTALGVPVHALLGGHGETSMTCYDGAIYFDDLDYSDLDDPAGLDVVLANCACDHELGYRAFKLKIGRGNKWMERQEGLIRDIDITRAVRAQYPDAEILVDANDGYSGPGFLEYLQAVADCRLFWVEEPFAENAADLKALKDSRALGTTLVADGEFEPDLEAVLALAEQHLLDVLLMDVVSFGFTAWRQVMPRVRQAGVHASPHAWGVPLKTLYAAQLAAGLGNVITVEGVPGVMEGMDASGYVLREGRLTVPSTPGFGIPLPPVELTAVS
ncbi:MAG TPA: enolase C-terminal domain-like protein [Mycobacteriales bacterium]|nr:enolase C-terminal domain-like protein [Mycobacteriales bacterium]